MSACKYFIDIVQLSKAFGEALEMCSVVSLSVIVDKVGQI